MERHVPRKRFGQHFLVDQGLIAQILEAINPHPQEHFLEIGPGLGALTRPLLSRVSRIDAVELDRDVIARLRAEFPADRLTLHAGDVLAFDFRGLASPLRVVGNLPYNISTPILFKIAEVSSVIGDAHFMLQKEVVERMVAKPRTADYGRLSVMLQWSFEMEWVLDVPPEAFNPPPKVDSAVVRMIPKPKRLPVDENALSTLVRQAFSQRRKMLRSTLKPLLSEAVVAGLGVNPEARAEELSLEEFVALAQALGTIKTGNADRDA